MFDQSNQPRKRIAIVGAGISGLSAAYYLSAQHDVTVYEAEARLGGHARTVLAGKNGDQPVDTGFIVFNYATYPYLTKLFRELDVPVMQSEMSFAASIDDGNLEYGCNTLSALIAQKRNLLRPKFYKMVMDILRFGRNAEASAKDDTMTVRDLTQELGLGTWFTENYLMPMSGAIWSTPVDEVDQFPAKSLVQFFRNHALLAGMRQHQWWTVKGGSIEYVKRLGAAIEARGGELRLATPVQSVRRDGLSVQVTEVRGGLSDFDEIIFACHSDQARTILGEGATEAESEALSNITYQPNTAVLHCDESQMPKRRKAWASWVYRSQKGRIGVTYWMNRLQGIPESDPLFVTLNPASEIAESKIYDTVEFAHPIFDQAALKAQKQIREMQGQNRTWFAGAWNRHGFHEDGIASAMRIVRAINDRTTTETPNAIYNQGTQEPVSEDLRAIA
ncbi:protoporphyrinogen oxidase [Cognatishimia activa]|uniref:Protoporphyrinogen oxidase n=1 Tax=Cognatishimia activa TaxID=1715691 RepID=A0A0N7MC85_9RHOB|nr:FAD-dependent oxidoreductase [Cognatishimia activa]CUK27504.1 protoporphyrinogen oxidase [Cognatishimia activa]